MQSLEAITPQPIAKCLSSHRPRSLRVAIKISTPDTRMLASSLSHAIAILVTSAEIPNAYSESCTYSESIHLFQIIYSDILSVHSDTRARLPLSSCCELCDHKQPSSLSPIEQCCRVVLWLRQSMFASTLQKRKDLSHLGTLRRRRWTLGSNGSKSRIGFRKTGTPLN